MMLMTEKLQIFIWRILLMDRSDLTLWSLYSPYYAIHPLASGLLSTSIKHQVCAGQFWCRYISITAGGQFTGHVGI